MEFKVKIKKLLDKCYNKIFMLKCKKMNKINKMYNEIIDKVIECEEKKFFGITIRKFEYQKAKEITNKLLNDETHAFNLSGSLKNRLELSNKVYYYFDIIKIYDTHIDEIKSFKNLLKEISNNDDFVEITFEQWKALDLNEN